MSTLVFPKLETPNIRIRKHIDRRCGFCNATIEGNVIPLMGPGRAMVRGVGTIEGVPACVGCLTAPELTSNPRSQNIMKKLADKLARRRARKYFPVRRNHVIS